MDADHLCKVSYNFLSQQYFASIILDKVWDGDTPVSLVRDTPFIKIIKLFSYVHIVGS